MIITEGLDYLDMQGLLSPKISVDEYSAKMGDDDEIITLGFKVKGKQPAMDLVSWFERGYKWVLDAQVSDGEVSDGIHLVFVEIARRLKSPDQIVQLVGDLKTLSGMSISDFTLQIAEDECSVTVDDMVAFMPLSPRAYRVRKNRETNKLRILSGQLPIPEYEKFSQEVQRLRSAAGLQ